MKPTFKLSESSRIMYCGRFNTNCDPCWHQVAFIQNKYKMLVCLLSFHVFFYVFRSGSHGIPRIQYLYYNIRRIYNLQKIGPRFIEVNKTIIWASPKSGTNILLKMLVFRKKLECLNNIIHVIQIKIFIIRPSDRTVCCNLQFTFPLSASDRTVCCNLQFTFPLSASDRTVCCNLQFTFPLSFFNSPSL